MVSQPVLSTSRGGEQGGDMQPLGLARDPFEESIDEMVRASLADLPPLGSREPLSSLAHFDGLVQVRGDLLSQEMMAPPLDPGAGNDARRLATSAGGRDGKVPTERLVASAVGDAPKPWEVQQAYFNSRMASENSLEKLLGGRCRRTVHERNTGETRRRNLFLDIAEEHAADFESQWEERAVPHLPRQHERRGARQLLGARRAHLYRLNARNRARAYADGACCPNCLILFHHRPRLIRHLARSDCLVALVLKGVEPLEPAAQDALDRADAELRRTSRRNGTYFQLAQLPAVRAHGPLWRTAAPHTGQRPGRAWASAPGTPPLPYSLL